MNPNDKNYIKAPDDPDWSFEEDSFTVDLLYGLKGKEVIHGFKRIRCLEWLSPPKVYKGESEDE